MFYWTKKFDLKAKGPRLECQPCCLQSWRNICTILIFLLESWNALFKYTIAATFQISIGTPLVSILVSRLILVKHCQYFPSLLSLFVSRHTSFLSHCLLCFFNFLPSTPLFCNMRISSAFWTVFVSISRITDIASFLCCWQGQTVYCWLTNLAGDRVSKLKPVLVSLLLARCSNHAFTFVQVEANHLQSRLNSVSRVCNAFRLT